ncbi:hypothetical protein [Pararhizobium antarcticum]|uniref:hypothetical protein n=1 Tax=Pararhizobium antarcticum TaxID=1798805 RepID=UPI0015873330|nr:hypothetical protein [Pararhizobium antarcticum]
MYTMTAETSTANTGWLPCAAERWALDFRAGTRQKESGFAFAWSPANSLKRIIRS